MGDPQLEVLQYVPFKSFVQASFWHKLAEIKIDVDKLSDGPREIYGYYTNANAKECLFEVDYSAFNSEFTPMKFNYTSFGTLYNKNTIEGFKECDKVALLTSEGQKFLEDITTGRILEDPRRISRFFILSFADLKTHKYYYWFAFPAPLHPNAEIISGSRPTLLKDSPELSQHLEAIYFNLPSDQSKSFFILRKNEDDDGFKHYNLKDCINVQNLDDNFKDVNLETIYFCFSDPCGTDKPSWLLRLYLVCISYLCPSLHNKHIKVVGVRMKTPKTLGESLVWDIIVPVNSKNSEVPFVGWEPNAAGKMIPRCVSMADSMDPAKLAENSVYLNLKLMKWRIMPNLDLDILTRTRCLLFGAGTLGCAVARNLLGWGFKNITFLDSGKIHFSNPVRQTLYIHADAVDGNKRKALTAAERIKQINPNVVSTGHVVQVPMPGHPVGDSMRNEVLQNLDVIENAVKNCDVIFLLTDSRESRWLPTLLGSYHKKIVINAALGFDSYLVMRHGGHKVLEEALHPQQIDGLHCISGANLGCYFCNDVTAPGDSLRDRTLDQQCTVTRPGISNIAASYAVELLVSILQHKYKELAPAYYAVNNQKDVSIPEGLLGILPHSIRGMLGTFENILPATAKFSQCVACSQIVLDEYENRKIDFLFDVFNSTKYLEDLTGISTLAVCDSEIIECEDSDFEMSD